jgi:hypothetical protein
LCYLKTVGGLNYTLSSVTESSISIIAAPGNVGPECMNWSRKPGKPASSNLYSPAGYFLEFRNPVTDDLDRLGFVLPQSRCPGTEAGQPCHDKTFYQKNAPVTQEAHAITDGIPLTNQAHLTKPAAAGVIVL